MGRMKVAQIVGVISAGLVALAIEFVVFNISHSREHSRPSTTPVTLQTDTSTPMPKAPDSQPSLSSTTSNTPDAQPASGVEVQTKSVDVFSQKERYYYDNANNISAESAKIDEQIREIVKDDSNLPQIVQRVQPLTIQFDALIRRGSNLPVPELFIEADKPFQEALSTNGSIKFLINTKLPSKDIQAVVLMTLDDELDYSIAAIKLRQEAYRRAEGRD